MKTKCKKCGKLVDCREISKETGAYYLPNSEIIVSNGNCQYSSIPNSS